MISQAEMKDGASVGEFKSKIADLMNEGVYTLSDEGEVSLTDPGGAEDSVEEVASAEDCIFASADEVFAAAQEDLLPHETGTEKKYYGLRPSPMPRWTMRGCLILES